jgi:hypothetical protein
MRSSAAVAIAALALALAAPSAARADESAAPPEAAAPSSDGSPTPPRRHDPSASRLEPQPEFDEALILETGRRAAPRPEPDKISFSLRGEYELRYRVASDLQLEAPLTQPSARKLGQNQYLYHWLRLTPRFQFRDKLALVGQIDVPRGMVAGDTTKYVDQVRDAWTEPNWIEVQPRQLYLEWASPIGMFRVGQQTSHWGTGILANDGDHASMFGDYQRGSIVERLLYVVPPLGKGTPLLFIVAGDLVFEDNTADLLGDDVVGHPRNGDRAFQGVAAVAYRTKDFELGVYGVYRHQERDAMFASKLTPFTETLEVGSFDLTGKFNRPVPGAHAWLYGQAEAAMVFGETTYVRGGFRNGVDPTRPAAPEQIRSFGAAATLGVVREARDGRLRWGDVVAELAWGFASGDANPSDGVTRRFTMDPNHNAGLVLFDHVLAWKTARAATIAQDAGIVNRPTPGLDFLPSKGGVFGATYLNPRLLVRPRPWLDLKAGVLIAQTTADFVDPYHAGALGSFVNYDGGDARRHDLGVELDLGFMTRIAFSQGTTIELGGEGGALFPGHAFDDARGRGLDNQYVGNFKVGLLY